MDDPEAFRALYRAHYPAVCRYLARRAAPDAVEDLAAETFLAAWRRRGDVPEPALPWLYNTAAKCLANHRRGQARRLALADLIARQPVDDGPGVEAEAAIAARRRALFTALESLRATDRELLMLRYWEELSPRELAVAAGISRVAARQRLHRAERRLRAAWLDLEAEGAPATAPLHTTRTLTPMEGTNHGS